MHESTCKCSLLPKLTKKIFTWGQKKSNEHLHLKNFLTDLHLDFHKFQDFFDAQAPHWFDLVNL